MVAKVGRSVVKEHLTGAEQAPSRAEFNLRKYSLLACTFVTSLNHKGVHRVRRWLQSNEF